MAAMLASAATPAMADRGWGGGRYHRGGGHDDGLGIFVGIAALFGAVALVASSANKDKRAAEARNAPPPPDPRYDSGYQDGSTVESAPPPATAAAAPTGSEEAAVDDCALAARDEGSREAGYAEVRDITNTRVWNGGWAVDGTIDQRQGYRGQGVTRRFSCTWRDGKVSDMILSRDSVALADTPQLNP
jgi:hypothetical protein